MRAGCSPGKSTVNLEVSNLLAAPFRESDPEMNLAVMTSPGPKATKNSAVAVSLAKRGSFTAKPYNSQCAPGLGQFCLTRFSEKGKDHK
jgi:hypothetical protein